MPCEGNALRDEPNRRRSLTSGLAEWVWGWVRARGNRECVVCQLLNVTIVRTASSPRIKSLIYLMLLSLDEREFLGTFRGFAARAATALFAQRRIFCRSQAFATARLNCAFAVVRQSLAEPALFW